MKGFGAVILALTSAAAGAAAAVFAMKARNHICGRGFFEKQ